VWRSSVQLDQAGLGDRVTILARDPRDTLADVPSPVGLVLLGVCLPVLRLLEPRLAMGGLVIADDIALPAWSITLPTCATRPTDTSAPSSRGRTAWRSVAGPVRRRDEVNSGKLVAVSSLLVEPPVEQAAEDLDSIVLRQLAGRSGRGQGQRQRARLLRRQDGDEVMFTSSTFVTSIDDVLAFAGANDGRAIVEDTARHALTRWDDCVTHHEIAVDLRTLTNRGPATELVGAALLAKPVHMGRFSVSGRDWSVRLRGRAPT
jgi:hypothetical protein